MYFSVQAFIVFEEEQILEKFEKKALYCRMVSDILNLRTEV